MAGPIKVNILTGFEDKGVKDAMQALRGLGAGFKNIAKQLVGAYVGFQGFQKGVEFIKSSLDASRDLQRNLEGLKTIFGENTAEMQKFSEAGVQMGMSTAEAAKATTFIGSVMKQSGFAMEDNIFFTQKLVSLGADLAATYGYDVQEALTGMTALFRGEYDPIEKFGVAIKQAQVNTLLAEKGLSGLTGTAKLNAQQLARMTLLFQSTADVQGAFQRQTNTLAVSQQQLAATFTNLKSSLGDSLIGPVTSLVKIMMSLTAAIGPSLTNLFIAIGGMFGLLGENANSAAGQIAGLIDQMTGLVNAVAPIFQFLILVITQMGSSLITGIIAFKILRSVVGGIGTAFTAFGTIIEAVRLKQLASAAATNVDTVAKGANTVATRTLAAAMVATPWGAIAMAIGLVGGALFALGSQTAPIGGITRSLQELKDELYFEETNLENNIVPGGAGGFDAARRRIKNLQQQIDLLNLSAGRANDALEVMAVGRSGRDKLGKTKTKEDKSPESMLDALQGKNFNEAIEASKKAAKAMADPFKKMVQTIKDDMKKIQESIVSAFDITNMGTKGGSISRNIDKFMRKLREFSGYIKTLREKGLSGDLLQQLAMAGPEKGLAAAKAFAGSPELVSQANAAYGELGTTASAIASNVVQAKAAPIYNINVNAGVGDKKTIGMAVVEAIKSFERTNGKGWRS